ncbi:MAG: RNase adapter RapZ [Succinivibrio sp.]|nr:RNase adapter RapZ [Succinivibrio sp.]
MAVNVELVIISGRSGSGKSVALHSLEDLGFYCIDNLPVIFLRKLIEYAKDRYPKLAVSIDIRNIPNNLQDLADLYITTKKDPHIKSTIIFIDAEDYVLVKRYSETRRLHPLSKSALSLDEAIVKEARILSKISSVADLRIDSSSLSIHDLSAQVITAVQGNPDKKLIMIFESFGFKDGVAKDADFVFDSRFLPNPYWVKALRPYNGLDEPIKEFFKKYPEVENYINQLDDLLRVNLPMMEKSNRSYLTIAVGCTGGFHRSVYIAQSLADRYKKRGCQIRVRHRSLAALKK